MTRIAVLLVLLVPAENLRVQVPAEIIETWLAGKFFDFGAGLLLQMQKSHDYIRNLYPGIVDVILNIHFPARKMQQANKSIAQYGIAQMSDVRGLVRIDAGVLDQNLPSWNVDLRLVIGS